MDRERTTKEWLASLDPVEYQEIARTISDIERDRQEARHRKLEGRRGPREKPRRGRYLRLERVKCGKKGCRRCTGEHPELHGPYWYLYRPKRDGTGRTSEYVGKALPEKLAKEFGTPEDENRLGCSYLCQGRRIVESEKGQAGQIRLWRFDATSGRTRSAR